MRMPIAVPWPVRLREDRRAMLVAAIGDTDRSTEAPISRWDHASPSVDVFEKAFRWQNHATILNRITHAERRRTWVGDERSETDTP